MNEWLAEVLSTQDNIVRGLKCCVIFLMVHKVCKPQDPPLCRCHGAGYNGHARGAIGFEVDRRSICLYQYLAGDCGRGALSLWGLFPHGGKGACSGEILVLVYSEFHCG